MADFGFGPTVHCFSTVVTELREAKTPFSCLLPSPKLANDMVERVPQLPLLRETIFSRCFLVALIQSSCKNCFETVNITSFQYLGLTYSLLRSFSKI